MQHGSSKYCLPHKNRRGCATQQRCATLFTEIRKIMIDEYKNYTTVTSQITNDIEKGRDYLQIFVSKNLSLISHHDIFTLRDEELKKYYNDYYLTERGFDREDVTTMKIVFIYGIKKKTEEQKYVECLTYFLGL